MVLNITLIIPTELRRITIKTDSPFLTNKLNKLPTETENNVNISIGNMIVAHETPPLMMSVLGNRHPGSKGALSNANARNTTQNMT
jgi:hypothetical protein